MVDADGPDYHIVIPARMASQRLPGKPLAEIAGKPLIEHVYRQAQRSGARQVTVATDDERIAAAAASFGARVLLTSALHQSGTDRIAECAARLGLADAALVVNLQGDEPLMPPACLDQVATLLAGDAMADCASLFWPIDDAAELRDDNVVKVVTAADGSAIYFSRAVIPYPRDGFDPPPATAPGAPVVGVQWKRHVGLYAWRVGALRRFTRLPQGQLERVEKLEQLRLLENGGRILMAQACQFIPAGVDTPADLHRVRAELHQ